MQVSRYQMFLNLVTLKVGRLNKIYLNCSVWEGEWVNTEQMERQWNVWEGKQENTKGLGGWTRDHRGSGKVNKRMLVNNLIQPTGLLTSCFLAPKHIQHLCHCLHCVTVWSSRSLLELGFSMVRLVIIYVLFPLDYHRNWTCQEHTISNINIMYFLV